MVMGGHKVKGKKYGGKIPDWGTRKMEESTIGNIIDKLTTNPPPPAKDSVVRPEVANLQKMLKSLGYDLGNYGPNKDGVDGIMGFYTQKALEAYKQKIKPKDVPKPTIKTPDDHELEMSNNFILPVNGRVSSPFGHRVAPIAGATTNHPGVDIAVPLGTPVKAPENAIVQKVSKNNVAGLYINLGNGKGVLMHRLLHLSKAKVKVGDVVKQGEIIALSGSTGLSTGPHLHWERYEQGKLVNPLA
jgi:murein DD-endopeptidase MepM/ murein hydrolase activator NlpD